MKLIVGVDPGKNVGIAILDISSDFVKTFSKSNFSLSNACKLILDNGEPIIIATDKRIVPKSIEKIAAAFNAKLFSPKADMSVSEKKELTKGFAFNNNHERDALASAILAKRHFSTTFEKIDFALAKKNLSHLSDAVKELLVKQEVGNIEMAIKLLTKEKKENDVKIIPKVIETKKVLELNEKLKLRDRAIELLRKQIEELKEENRELVKMAHVHDDSSRIENLRKSIASLKKEKEELLSEKEKEDMKKSLSDNYEIIYTPEDFDKPEDMKARVVIIDNNNFSVAKFEPKAIISGKIPEKLKIDTPVIQRQQINIRKIDNVLVVDRKELDIAIKNCFFAWLKKYKERFDEKE